MKLRKVLIATDFSEGARAAVDRGVALATVNGAEVLLLHVCCASPYFPTAVEALPGSQQQLAELMDRRRERGSEQLAELCAEVKERHPQVRTELAEGPAAKTIARVAASWGADLVVTGARGATDDAVFIIGSVAEGVVKRCDTSVLVIRGNGHRRGFSRILVSTDLTEASKAVVPMALIYATSDVEVELLHVVEWGEREPPFEASHSARADFRELWSSAVEEVERELTALVQGVGREGATVRHAVLTGVPAATILARAREHDCDLLVVGRRRDTPPLFASVAERLTRHAHCSVLVARRLPRRPG
jgi:nucleotide-binding universal stress UspA family protein